MKTHSTRPRRRRGTTDRARVEHTPNGGKIVRCGRFTIVNGPALPHFFETDPLERLWRFADQLCDRQLMPYPEYPVYDPYNRPGYPDGDPALWTPDAAIKLYGCHLVH